MSLCGCGSEKKSTAPEFINPNEIGVLCFLFGLEGELCRLLDLVPEAVKKIVQLDPNKGNADKVFGDILKKVLKTSFGIIFDEAGDINVENWCKLSPPPEPEEITYSDIFIFIAELVSILDVFFRLNEILTGDSTRLLDKIVAIWLRKKHFELCDCKDCPPPPPDDPIPFNPPPVLPPPTCLDENGNPVQAECQPIYIRNNTSNSKIIRSCSGFWTVGTTINVPKQIGNTASTKATAIVSNEQGYEYIQSEIQRLGTLSYADLVNDTDRFILRELVDVVLFGGIVILLYSTDGINFSPTLGNIPVPKITCPPPKNKKRPPELCALFPFDPICLPSQDPNNPDCEEEYAIVQVSLRCTGLKVPVSLALNTSVSEEEVTVIIGDCNGRTSQKLKLAKCKTDPPIEEVLGCTDPTATNYDPQATKDDGSCIYAPVDCEYQYNAFFSGNEYNAVRYIQEQGYTLDQCVDEFLLRDSFYQTAITQYPRCDFISIFRNIVQSLL